MASAKLIQRVDKQNSKGRCPLYLRFISYRNINYQFLGYRIHPKDWDAEAGQVRKSFKNSTRINAYLSEENRNQKNLFIL
jgi:hypothetical protein